MRHVLVPALLALVLVYPAAEVAKNEVAKTGTWDAPATWGGSRPNKDVVAVVQGSVTLAGVGTAAGVTVGGERPGTLILATGASIHRGDQVIDALRVRPGSAISLTGGGWPESVTLTLERPEVSAEDRYFLIRNVWMKPGSNAVRHAAERLLVAPGGVLSGSGAIGTRSFWIQNGARLALESGALNLLAHPPGRSYQIDGELVLGSATGAVKLGGVENQKTEVIVRAGGVLRGHGVWPVGAQVAVQGRVVADGFGTPHDLDLSRWTLTADCRNDGDESGDPGRMGGWLEQGQGWWAERQGRLLLPPGTLDGDGTVFGQVTGAPSLVGAVRVTAAPAGVTVAVLAPDRTELAGLKGAVVSAWEITGLTKPSAVVMRWHDGRMRMLNADPGRLVLMAKGPSGWQPLTASLSPADLSVSASVGSGVIALVAPADGVIAWDKADAAATFRDHAPTDEEFNGPFAGWVNVRDFGAKGDGVADDTDAIQQAIQAVLPEAKSVVYLPAGTYRITRTLLAPGMSPDKALFTNKVLVGQDPATTILRWDGATPADGVTPSMLHVQGAHSTRIGRLSFDGAGKAAGLRVERNAAEFGIYSSYGRVHDVWFTNCTIGFWNSDLLKPQSDMDSEYSLMRLRFTHCGIGASIIPGNGYDYWIREGTFTDCGVGVHSSEGDFRVANSVFRQSRVADITCWGHRGGGVRDNVSVGSRRFIVFKGNMVLQGNRILDPIEDDAIQLHEVWGATLLDNAVRSRSGARGPVVHELATRAADKDGRVTPIIAIGNRFTVAEPLRLKTSRQSLVGNRTVKPADFDSSVQLPTAAPAVVTRQVIEAPTADDLQAAIDQAAALASATPVSRPVVHIPPNIGKHGHWKTIVVPAGVHFSIQGDGLLSRLAWSGPKESTDPSLLLRGPSRVEISDLFIINHDRPTVPAVVVDRCDQPGARVWGDNLHLPVQVAGLAHTRVDLTEYMFGSVAVAGAAKHGPGRTAIFAGAGSGDQRGLSLTGGGRLFACDVWFEDGAITQPWAVAEGAGAQPGELALQAMYLFQPHGEDQTVIAARSFAGTLSMLGLGNTGTSGSEGDGSHLTVVNLQASSPLTKGKAAALSQCDLFGEVVGMDQASLDTRLAFQRAQRWEPVRSPTPDGSTDLRLRRICGLIPHGSGILLRSDAQSEPAR